MRNRPPKISLAVGLIVSVVWLTGIAWGQDSSTSVDERLMELERKLEEQSRTIQEQQRRLDRYEATQDSAGAAGLDEAAGEYLDKKKSEGKYFELSDLSLQGAFKNGFKWNTVDGQHQIKVGGRLQFDAVHSFGDRDPSTSTFNVRRARIFAAGKLFKYYYYKVQVDIFGGADLQDGYIDIRYWDEAQLKMGQFKAPFGLEKNQSSKYVPLIERSMASDFMTPSHQVGAMLHGKLLDKRLNYYVGLFNGNGDNTRDDNDHKEFAGRLILAPFKNTEVEWLQGFRIGGAATYGRPEADLAGGGPRTAMRTRFWTYNNNVVSEDERVRWSVETEWHHGSCGLQAEYMEMIEDMGMPTAGGFVDGHAHIHGWYATATYFLTGEKSGVKRVQPNSPFDPLAEERGTGAWQLAARAGQIFTDDNIEPFITGADRATQVMGGINWYPNSMVRFSLNYQHADFGDRISGERGEDSILFRCQLEF